MAGGFFRKKYGVDPSSFDTIDQIDKFIESKIGKPLKVEYLNQDIVSPRGSTFPIKDKKPHIDSELNE